MKNKYECCECGWTGFHSEKDQKPDNKKPFLDKHVCPNCRNESFYEIENEECSGEQLPLTDAIQFGNYLNQNAEKWGDEWVLDDGKNYTTSELYRKFKEDPDE